MSNATYRFENAKQGRAGCQNSACKNDGIKIAKGELRLGSLVTFKEHTTWKWKHWGCVSPRQIENMQAQIGGVGGLDLDKDLPDILDGYEDLDSESQEEIKYALINGHVRDEVWKGDLELNRPGQKGINKRTPKKKATSEDAIVSDAEHSSPSKPKKRSKKSAVEDDDEEPAPKKKVSRKRKAAVADDDEDDEVPIKKCGRGKKAIVKDEGSESEAIPEPPKRKPRAKKVKAVPEPEAKAEPESEAEDILPGLTVASHDQEPADEIPLPKKRGKKVAAENEEAGDEPVAIPAKRGKTKKTETADPEFDEDGVQLPSRRSSRPSRAKA